MKDYRYPALFSLFCYMGFGFSKSLPIDWLWIKYVSFAFMLFYITRYCFKRGKLTGKHKHMIYHSVVWTVMSGYCILCLDTFVFHAWLPISGMLRYALFDFYVFSAPLFILLGIIDHYAEGRNA